MVLSARHACLIAAALFVGLALLIARLAVAPLGAADLVGIAACAAAAGAFATLAFTLRPASIPATAGAIDTDALASQVAAAVEARLRPAVAAGNAEPPLGSSDSRPPLTAAEIPAPAASAKPRLGRGLAGLMHHPSALSKAPAAPAASEDRAAA
jgi:hypothetical protein